MLRASGWNLRGKWAKEQKGHLIMEVFSKARQQAMVWCIYNCLLFPHTHHKNLWLHRMDVYQWTAVGQGDPLELPHTGWDYSTKNVTLSAHPHTAEPTRWLRKHTGIESASGHPAANTQVTCVDRSWPRADSVAVSLGVWEISSSIWLERRKCIYHK